MRINKLEFNAFGPYPDLVKIDFVPINERQLFLITGPTGCGKTTIFDAISFALFAETSGTYRDVGELRSHLCKTNEKTYVKLEFEINSTKYTITRYPRQELINQRGNLSNYNSEATLILPSGDIIDGVRNVDEYMKSILKITSSQFKHIVMLAQGEFRKMLFANSKDREEIFRAIFGTDDLKIFQEILQEMTKGVNKEREIVCDRIDNTSSAILLSEEKKHAPFSYILLNEGKDPYLDFIQEEIKKIELNIQKNEKESKELTLQYNKIKDEKQECKIINDQITELENKKVRLVELGKQKQTIENKKQLVGKIQNLPYYESLEEHFQKETIELDEMKSNFLKDKKALSDNKTLLKQKTEKLKETEEEILRFTKQSEDWKVSYYKDNLQQYFQFDELLNNKKTLEKEIDYLTKEIESIEKIINQKTKELNNALNSKSNLECNVSGKTNILKEINEVKNNRTLFRTMIEDCEKFLSAEKNLFELTKKSNEEGEKYSNLSNQLTSFEISYSKYQAGILATELKDGDPCPVCGSINHPRKAKIENNEVSKERLDQLKEACNQQLSQFNNINLDIKELLGKKELLQSQLKKNLALSSLKWNEGYNKTFLEELNRNYKKSDTDFEDLNKKFNEIEKEEIQLQAINTTINSLNEDIKEKSQRLNSLREKKAGENSSFINMNRQIENTKKTLPENYENAEKLKSFINQCLDYQKQLDEGLNKLKTEITVLTTTIKENEISIDKNEKILKTKDSALIDSKKDLNNKIISEFGNLDYYNTCKEQKQNVIKLKQEIESYSNEILSISTLISDLEKKTQDKTFVNLAKFDDNLKVIENKQKELTIIRDQLLFKSRNNKEGLNNLKQLYKSYLQIQKQYNLLSKLDNIARGNNDLKLSFERYILASYFDNVLVSANIKLKEMTGMRYEFVKKEGQVKGRAQQGLDINIFDNYSGRERDVKSLSGGELFKASLALALGLSDLIQQNVGGISINTLFIDEGFGSLDSESLDNALQALTDIQAKGKILGIISHVQEVKDRFPTKIMIGVTKEGSYIKNITL